MQDQQLNHIRKISRLVGSDQITVDEFVNEFLYAVFESPIETIQECASLVPYAARSAICDYLHDFVDLDYFDTRHMFDKRTHEHKRAMHDHYERVTQILLALLDCNSGSLST